MIQSPGEPGKMSRSAVTLSQILGHVPTVNNQRQTWHKQRNQNKDTDLYDRYHFGFPSIKNFHPGPDHVSLLGLVICLPYQQVTVPVTWSYFSNVIQYQMCKQQLIKRTSVLSFLIVACQLIISIDINGLIFRGEKSELILTILPWLEPEPSVSCLCQRLPTMLLRFFPTSSCILSSPLRAWQNWNLLIFSTKMF